VLNVEQFNICWLLHVSESANKRNINELLVPDRRRIGHVNGICFIVLACVAGKRGKEGQWGLGKGPKSGAVDSEHVAYKGRSSKLRTRSHHFK
jgi:hypothetical protein